MNIIIFLAITLTLATVTVAKTYEEMDTTAILKEIQNIMKINKIRTEGLTMG
jgi:Flp pilus assembly protein TadD